RRLVAFGQRLAALGHDALPLGQAALLCHAAGRPRAAAGRSATHLKSRPAKATIVKTPSPSVSVRCTRGPAPAVRTAHANDPAPPFPGSCRSGSRGYLARRRHYLLRRRL